MHTIDLAYVGRGIHEELVAYVADQEGYYEDEGVHVAIRDGISWETERLRRGATIGCPGWRNEAPSDCRDPRVAASGPTRAFGAAHRQAMRRQGGFTTVPIVTYQLADEQYTDEQVQQLLTASARVYAEILERRAGAHQ